jgi:tetratricopeptide (TPR) repeat protein
MKRSIHLAGVLLAALALGGCDYFRSPEQRVERAEALIGKGEQRAALIELRNALKDRPDQPKARLLLADVALWLGDQGAAERELRSVPADFEPERRADVALRVDLAAARFAEVLARIGTPDDAAPATLWLYRALANQGLGRLADAERDYTAALERDSQLVAAAAGIVEMRAAQGDTNGAHERSRALTRDFPESAIAWFVRGALLARASSNQEAQDALERASALAPRQIDVLKQVSLLVTLTEVQIANRDLENARATAGILARVAPGSPIAQLNSARVKMASNDFEGAASELRRVVNQTPQFTRARYLLGVTLAAQGSLSQASQELTTVIAQMPNNMEARQLLAQVRMRLEDPDSALRVLVPALEAGGDDRIVNQLFEAARVQAGDSPTSLALIEREYEKAPNNLGLKLQLASAYVRAEQGAKALALLRDSGNVRDPLADRIVLAATAQVEGETAARRKLDAMLAARPGDTDLVLIAAQLHLGVREVPQARQLLETALARDADHGGLRLALARVQLVGGQRDEAVGNLERLRGQDAHATEARLLLAQLALQRDDAKEAGTLIAEALKGTEQVAETQNAAGLMYLGTGRYDAALEHFRAGAQADPTNATLWLNLGRAQLALEQSDAARESLQQALKLRVNWVPAEGALAFLEVQSGNSTEALKRVDALKVARPHDPDVHVLEAEVRAALQQYPEAERALQLAARRKPSAGLALKIYQLRVAGQLPKPTEPLEKWLETHPDDLRVRTLLAEAYARADERQAAVRHYEVVIARQPRDAVAHNNLAWLYLQLGDRRALATARRAAALAPDAAPIADTLGWILVQTGSVAEGLGYLKRAAEADPRNEDMQYHYAYALAQAGKSGDALARLRTLLGGTSRFESRAEAEELLERLNKAQL